MTENIIITAIGGVVALLQALMIFILAGIRNDNKELWKRIYGHYHEIQCSNDECRTVKTGNVIVPHDQA